MDTGRGLRSAILLSLYSAETDETSLPSRVIVVGHGKTKGILLNVRNYKALLHSDQ